MVDNDHGSRSVSESQGGRIPDADLGGRGSWTPMRNYDYPCRKAKAAGSKMLIYGDQHMVTQQAFAPLVNQDFEKKKQTSGSNIILPGTLVEACRVKTYLNHFSCGFTRDKQVTLGTKRF